MDRGVWHGCVVATLLACALAGAPSAWASNPTPSQAITELNNWRAQLGESLVSTTDVSAWDTGCQHHNSYEQQNNILTHPESSSNPGYTSDGAIAGPDSVLAESITSPVPPSVTSQLPAPTWDGAVFHRQALLQPRLANVGYNSTTFGSGSGPFKTWTCMWDQNLEGPPSYAGVNAIDNSRTTTGLKLYPSPANGAYDVPQKFPGNESPDPNSETGVNGATLGWLISVAINGPWANAGGGGIVFAHDVTATLEPDGTTNTVPVVVSECGSNGCAQSGGTSLGLFFGGGFGIFPKQALAANTTYHVEAAGTVTDDTNSGSPITYSFDKTWCFSTGTKYTTSSDCFASSTGAAREPGVVPGAPTVTSSSLSYGGGRATFKFTLHAGKLAPPIRSFVVTVPSGFHFSTTSSALANGVTIVGNPKHSASATSSRLTVKLASALSTVQVKIANPALHSGSPSPPFTFLIAPTDNGGTSTTLRVKFS